MDILWTSRRVNEAVNKNREADEVGKAAFELNLLTDD